MSPGLHENAEAAAETPESVPEKAEIVGPEESALETPATDVPGTPEKAAEELNELRDKHLRLYAEFENFRRRTAKESFETMATANARLIGKLTEVLDNFHRAFDPKLKGASPEEFEKGIRLIHARLWEILEEEGVEEIAAEGREFDPNLHEALLQQASDTVPEHHVIQTVQRGYKLKSKILTHAKVIVSKGKE
jgi:molecular chaperone GrpE